MLPDTQGLVQGKNTQWPTVVHPLKDGTVRAGASHVDESGASPHHHHRSENEPEAALWMESVEGGQLLGKSWGSRPHGAGAQGTVGDGIQQASC